MESEYPFLNSKYGFSFWYASRVYRRLGAYMIWNKENRPYLREWSTPVAVAALLRIGLD